MTILGGSEELVSRCIECDLAEPESLASLGGSAPGVVDGILSAAYAKENDLLALEGWHRFRSLAKKYKVLARAIMQSKIRQVRRSQTYMFGYLIPRNYMEAMQFDSENKNSK